jgi:tripartite-type tricarboxylate transporter receptor subunit TctC
MLAKFRKQKRWWLRYWILSLFSATIFTGLISLSEAADYPNKPIQLIVPFAPGGGGDITARLISPKVSALLGQAVAVVNKPGGGSVLGTYAAMATPPDGYTILSIHPPQISAPLVNKDVTFDIHSDFIMINLAVTSPSLVIVKKDAPWKTLEEFIAEAKKNPGKLTYSSIGYGGTAHFSGELFKMSAGTDLIHVPMDGTAPAVTAVLGGHINVTFPEFGAVYKYLQAGSLRALAVMDKKRLKIFPEIPTTVEKGYPELITASWGGFAVIVKTPKLAIDKLEKAFKEALKDKELMEKFETTGWVVENLASEEATRFVAKDQQDKIKVARALKMVPK